MKALCIKVVLPAATLTILTLMAVSARTVTARAVIADWQSAKAYTAVVSSTEATFVFELPEREEWDRSSPRLKSGATRGDRVLALRSTARHLSPAREPLG